MTDRSLERRVETAVREGVVIGFAKSLTPEHHEEVAYLLAIHRTAEAERRRARAWDRAMGLVTRPLRRHRQ